MRRDELIGRTIANRFRVKRVLGEGGMATVFVAEQDAEPREIALKVLRADLHADKTFAKRFEREAKAAARVQHPSSVTILDAGVEGDVSYIAMELLRGDDLYALLERHGALSARAAARIVAEVCDALAVAHGLGIVHRDLKPENIMIVSGDGAPDSAPLPATARVKVLDFGIAKVLDVPEMPRPPQGSRLESPSGMTSMTRVGTMIGTPAYMSPEQCALQPVDTRSDIYTCGLLLFQMVSGRLPFDGPTPLHIATKHLHEDPPPLREFVPEADATLEAIILKTLSKRPMDRYATARMLAAALRKLMPELPDRAYPGLARDQDSAATPVLLDDSITSLRDAGLPESIGQPSSDLMASAKTIVAEGVAAPPPSVVVREGEAQRKPLAILARHPAPGAPAAPRPAAPKAPATPRTSQPSQPPRVTPAPQTPTLAREPDAAAAARKPIAILARHPPAPAAAAANATVPAGPGAEEDSITAPGAAHDADRAEAPRKPLAVLARHPTSENDPPPATPTMPLAPGVEAEPEDLASTLVRGTPGDTAALDEAIRARESHLPAAGGGRQLTMQSAAPQQAGERSARVAVVASGAPSAPAAQPKGAVQTLVSGQAVASASAAISFPQSHEAPYDEPPVSYDPVSRDAVPQRLSSPEAAAAPTAAPYTGPPALVAVPAKAPIPVMPSASVILSPSVAPAVHMAPLAPPPAAPLAPPPAAPRGADYAAPTFGIPGPPAAPPASLQAGFPAAAAPTVIAGAQAQTVGKALWLGVIIGVLGSAILFALAYLLLAR